MVGALGDRHGGEVQGFAQSGGPGGAFAGHHVTDHEHDGRSDEVISGGLNDGEQVFAAGHAPRGHLEVADHGGNHGAVWHLSIVDHGRSGKPRQGRGLGHGHSRYGQEQRHDRE